MDSRERLLALIKLANNEINGRTKFQKIVYILKNLGVEFPEKYKYHYFGPYSYDLQLEIDELVEQGIIKEENFTPYIYKINEEYIDEVNEKDLLDKKDLIQFLANQDYQALELVSTIYYLLNNELINDDKVIKNKLKLLKPHLQNKIDLAYEILQTIQKYDNNGSNVDNSISNAIS